MDTDEKLFVRLQGGIGNQMFQYAFYRNLKFISRDVTLDLAWFKRGNRPLKIFDAFDLPEANKLDEYHESKIYKPITVRLINRVLRKISKYELSTTKSLNRFIFENDDFYPQAYLHIKNATLVGYWQSEEYFSNIKSQIPKIFSFKQISNESVNAAKYRILNSHQNTSLHWRRGDYVGNKSLGLNLDKYFMRSLKYLINERNIKQVFVFTEDTDWVKKKLYSFGIVLNYYFISDEILRHEDFHELYLMTQCENNIISNSSFSWWGAYLNQKKDKIVCAPDKWTNVNYSIRFKDILPIDWISIEVD